MFRCALVCLLLAPIVAVAAPPAVPGVVPIQGTLTDLAGGPINGAQKLTLNIYTVSAGGAAIYTEVQSSVSVDLGVFTAYMGSVTPLDMTIFNGQDLWLGITVGTDAEMSPRLRFGSVPYAVYAQSTGNATIPTGAVMFFALGACPSGWTAYAAAQGRTVVGLPSAGTLEGTYPVSGGALTNQQALMISGVGAHTHAITAQTTSSHTHSHAVTTNVTMGTDGAHTHGEASAGAHTHNSPLNTGGGGAAFAISNYVTNSLPPSFTGGTDSQGAHVHTINTTGSSHNHTLTNGAASSDANTHSHTLSGATASTGAPVDVTMPYVQLLACKKN